MINYNNDLPSTSGTSLHGTPSTVTPPMTSRLSKLCAIPMSMHILRKSFGIGDVMPRLKRLFGPSFLYL